MINVESSGWAQEVVMRKHRILHEMNKKVGTKLIRDLRTAVKEPEIDLPQI